MIRKFKITGLMSDKEFARVPFGRQLEGLRAIESFKGRAARKTWVSQKRSTAAKEIKRLLAATGAKEYFCQYHDAPNYRDDTFEIWYA